MSIEFSSRHAERLALRGASNRSSPALACRAGSAWPDTENIRSRRSLVQTERTHWGSRTLFPQVRGTILVVHIVRRQPLVRSMGLSGAPVWACPVPLCGLSCGLCPCVGSLCLCACPCVACACVWGACACACVACACAPVCTWPLVPASLCAVLSAVPCVTGTFPHCVCERALARVLWPLTYAMGHCHTCPCPVPLCVWHVCLCLWPVCVVCVH